MRSQLIAKHDIEAWTVPERRAAARRIDPYGPESVQIRDSDVTQKELHAVLEIVVKVDFGDGHVDGDLCDRAIELIERPLDNTVSLRVGIDHDRIVRDVRQDRGARPPPPPPPKPPVPDVSLAPAPAPCLAPADKPPNGPCPWD